MKNEKAFEALLDEALGRRGAPAPFSDRRPPNA